MLVLVVLVLEGFNMVLLHPLDYRIDEVKVILYNQYDNEHKSEIKKGSSSEDLSKYIRERDMWLKKELEGVLLQGEEFVDKFIVSRRNKK